ncbi:hypothetical protein WA158_001932 [Blastocystis sp. Blastoise]
MIYFQVVLIAFKSNLKMRETELWSALHEGSTVQDLFEIIDMMNEKFTEGVHSWEYYKEDNDKFALFFKKVMLIIFDRSIQPNQLVAYINFMINSFRSLEDPIISKSILPTLSISLWSTMSERRRALEIYKTPSLDFPWQLESTIINIENNFEILKQNKVDESIYKEEETIFKNIDSIRKENEKNAIRQIVLIDQKLNDLIESQGYIFKEVYYNVKTMFIPQFIRLFFAILESVNIDESVSIDENIVKFCNRFIEYITDLLSQFPTRRYLLAYIKDIHFIPRCQLSSLYQRKEGQLFKQLVEECSFFEGFEIDEHTGNSISDIEMNKNQYKKIYVLQRICFKYFKDTLEPLSLASIETIGTRSSLIKYLNPLSEDILRNLCIRLRLTPLRNEQEYINCIYTKELLIEILLHEYCLRQSQIDTINELPLMPNDALLWDENLVPLGHYEQEKVLALPKLNLQFLTFHDYLLRNFNLYRLESCYEIRQDIVDAVKRCKPRHSIEGTTIFTGLSRMATPILSFFITEVRKPNIGDTKPAEVRAEITISYKNFGGKALEEWESLHEHDVLFLVGIQSKIEDEADYKFGVKQNNLKVDLTPRSLWKEEDCSFPEREGIVSVRGCEILEIVDEDGVSLNDPTKPDKRIHRKGKKRVLRVLLDTAQYQVDMIKQSKGEITNPYTTFNLLVRRKSKENNFKAVLDTIRELMNITQVGNAVPLWMQDIFLGYGNPSSAYYKNMNNQLHMFDFQDTFLDKQHILDSFPDYNIQFLYKNGDSVPESLCIPPYKISFPIEEDKKELIITPYTSIPFNPFINKPIKKNMIRFTPKQIEAIHSGMSNGLTIIVGPPGTGKTDVAVQIINNIYHDYPLQKTLLVTHSNHALNDLFSKITELNIDGRHLLRLGMGENELETTEDYTRQGRVDYTLTRRLELLTEVEKIAKSLDIEGAFNYSCETAEYFYTYHIQKRIDQFRSFYSLENEESLQNIEDIEIYTKSSQEWDEKYQGFIAKYFPFKNYFLECKEQLFINNKEHDIQMAEQCLEYIKNIFIELKEYRPFELLRNVKQRSDYLLTNQAKIIALTCTHAGIMRKKLVEIGFKYDNIVIEEAGQILEIETFIPMLLQNFDSIEGCRLKRIILIGDHNQLPPIVKNQSFQQYSHLDQSLFTRFIRLGVPTIQLDAQGRCRPDIAELFSWKYKSLSNLPHVCENYKEKNIFQYACPGLQYDYQLINVNDYNGIGESQPSPWYYQNRGEAEYILLFYKYLRLLGYPSTSISILTTYNGQKHLLRDLFNESFKDDSFYSIPKINTVDKYQGQQNDIILLSLVRTKHVGHISDIKRLIVAVSRARLGLYIFCRVSLFTQCFELLPVFNLLKQRPIELSIVEGEEYNTITRKIHDPVDGKKISGIEEMFAYVNNMIVEYRKKMEVNMKIEEEKEKEKEKEKEMIIEEEEEEKKENPQLMEIEEDNKNVNSVEEKTIPVGIIDTHVNKNNNPNENESDSDSE